MTLKDFIVMCNNSNFVLNEDNGGDIAAKELADAWEHDADIIDEKNENTLLCQKIKRNIKNNHNKYCFLQNENLFIDINNLSPYFETNGVRILNQKWHVLISMLAVYDIASFDDEIINNDDLKKYNIGKIKEIHINEKSIKIEGERQTKILNSKMMIKWLTMILNDRG